MTPTDREKSTRAISKLLRHAAQKVETEKPECIAAAAWRLADAAVLLKVLLADQGHTDVIGVHKPTGLGACL